MKRRTWLGMALGGLGLYSVWRSNRRGKTHDPRFQNYQKILQEAQLFTPCVVVDLDILDQNIRKAQNHLSSQLAFRVVVKSLPFHGLYHYVAQKMGTNRFMVFHGPNIQEVIQTSADQSSSILLGKPMPVAEAHRFYRDNAPDHAIQWLIDSPSRLKEYHELALQKQLKIQINLEIDVGLHRGGFIPDRDWHNALQFLPTSSLQVEGLMGYDAHVPKVPGNMEHAFESMTVQYRRMKSDLMASQPSKQDWTFNGGGSPTLTLHRSPNTPINDVSAGSFALLPADFDIPTLAGYQPSAFIAAPVLKVQSGSQIPGIEGLSSAWPVVDPARERTAFLYGGAWEGSVYSPSGVESNSLYGQSTNQMMYNFSQEVELTPGDFLFFRPNQSERTLALFENAVGIRKGKIEFIWSQIR